jgi:FAD/FMN-containing dehydrogenase
MNGRSAVTGTGAALQARMRGLVIDPSDPGYASARRVWNGAVDRHPAMIACCQDTADVVTAVGFGRAHDLPIAVRAGGHGVAGRAVCDGGLVIDLRALSQVRVDPRQQLALAGAGTLNGEFDAATQRHGLATTAGSSATPGWPGSPSAAGSAGWRAVTAPPVTTSSAPRSSRPTARLWRPPTILTCCGRCAAQAPTSAWSPGWT